MVVEQPQSTRVEEPTLLCNQVDFHFSDYPTNRELGVDPLTFAKLTPVRVPLRMSGASVGRECRIESMLKPPLDF